MQGHVYPPGYNIRKFQMTLKAAPSMIYLPVEFERFPLALTLWHFSIYSGSEATFIAPKGKVGQTDTFFTQQGQHLWDVLSQILKTASESEGFFYTILCEIKGGHFNKLLPPSPCFELLERKCTIWGPGSLSKYPEKWFKVCFEKYTVQLYCLSFSERDLSRINLAADTAVFLKMPLAIKLSLITFGKV